MSVTYDKIEIPFTCLQREKTDHIFSNLQVTESTDIHLLTSFHLNSESAFWEVSSGIETGKKRVTRKEREGKTE